MLLDILYDVYNYYFIIIYNINIIYIYIYIYIHPYIHKLPKTKTVSDLCLRLPNHFYFRIIKDMNLIHQHPASSRPISHQHKHIITITIIISFSFIQLQLQSFSFSLYLYLCIFSNNHNHQSNCYILSYKNPNQYYSDSDSIFNFNVQ